MYESYTRQSLPSKHYRELLGSAICVFNSNNGFIIENILKNPDNDESWYKLVDKTSGRLCNKLKYIKEEYREAITSQFTKVVKMRDRIIHSYQVTVSGGEQVLATKDKDNRQYIITEEYLLEFIKENQTLSSLLHEHRGY